MTYNLLQYGLEDRDGDGQRNDPKPERERKVVIDIIATEDPDVLVVQEMGDPAVFKEFTFALAEAGLDYEHIEYLQRGNSPQLNMAVLSRYPIVASRPRTNDYYNIGDIKLAVSRGFTDVDIMVSEDYIFRLMGVHLKSKMFSDLGQTEMRRNEARLLHKHVRNALEDNPRLNLLVAGDMNDFYNSAALREVIGKHRQYLVDLRPRDYLGDLWTRYESSEDMYERIDYILVSEGMRGEVIPEKCHLVRTPDMLEGSDHRPVVAVFRARDMEDPPSASGQEPAK